MCRRIAEQPGGSLSATSDHRGAVFTLRLPLSARATDHEARPVAGSPPLSIVRDRQAAPPPA